MSAKNVIDTLFDFHVNGKVQYASIYCNNISPAIKALGLLFTKQQKNRSDF